MGWCGEEWGAGGEEGEGGDKRDYDAGSIVLSM